MEEPDLLCVDDLDESLSPDLFRAFLGIVDNVFKSGATHHQNLAQEDEELREFFVGQRLFELPSFA